MNYQPKNIVLSDVKLPKFPIPEVFPQLPDEVYQLRLSKVLDLMKKSDLDVIVIYADREHFANFNYIIGFEPRFEEGLAVLHSDGKCRLFLGNECFPMHKTARIPVSAQLYPTISLPSQPDSVKEPLDELLKAAGISSESKVGVVGWKLLAEDQFCIPTFIYQAIAKIVAPETIRNVTHLFIAPGYGIRVTNTEDEIAYYEHGATLASNSVWNAINSKWLGERELDIANKFAVYGQPLSCHPTIAAAENTKKGLISANVYRAKYGDPVTNSLGMRGGLSVRNGYLVDGVNSVPEAAKEFADNICLTYFKAVVAWVENMKIGVTGGEIFDLVNSIIPKEKFGWVLNPGHLISDEEWLSSPFAPGCTDKIVSGMLIQMDIIPSIDGYISPNCEDGFCIADEALQQKLKEKYPEVYERMIMRRDYMRNELNIDVPDEVLPMSNLASWYAPYYFNLNLAYTVQK